MPYEYDEPETETAVERRPKKKKLIPGLPNKVVVIKNADKDVGNWSETWDYPKNRSPGHIPHSFRLLALGAPGRGKTNYMKIYIFEASVVRKEVSTINSCYM